MKAIPVSMEKILRENVTLQVEIRVTGVRWFKFRLWLGSLILKLAARVMGCAIEIKRP